jgi:polyvinyl alcohol dehydrogenase (cytochrome)
LAVEALEDRIVPSSLGVDVVPADPNDWPMYNHDPAGSRDNFAEHTLSPATVGGLGVRWTFPTAGPIAGTPAVVHDHVYAADATGTVYALDRDGHELWETHLTVGPTFSNVKVTASPLVTNRTVIIGDLSGVIHGLDVDTGAEKWAVRPNPHQYASIWGSATMVGNDVAIGVASTEEFWTPHLPSDYVPSFRGSLVLLDPADGHVVWQTYTISDADSAAGAAIWSSPTYDRATNTIYATTGNNYSTPTSNQPTTGTEDAFIAFDAADGHIKWVNQRTQDDSWSFSFGDSNEAHPDFDIGDSPQIYKLGGRTVVSAGQKSGFFHVLDAATGQQVSAPIQLAPSGTVGGLFADSAYANGVVYANGTEWPDLFAGGPPKRGILSAVAADGSHELWHFDTPFSPDLSGVAVANGVVYFQSSFDGTLFALDARTGTVLAQVVTGGQSSGPAVSRGQIYLGTGDTAFPGFIQGLPLGPGSIVALGLGAGHLSGPSVAPRLSAGLPSGGTPAAAAAPTEHATPFQAKATGSISSATPTGFGLLLTFVTHGTGTYLGQYTSTGSVLRVDDTVFGTETFTAANGDHFVKTFTGTFQPDGTLVGTYTLGGGTGRFAGIGGSGTFTAVFAANGIDFDLTIVGEALFADHGKP